MAISNQERVGKAMEPLRQGIAPFVEREFTLCERKKRAAEALAYNGLVQSWPEIARLARDGVQGASQAQLFQ